MAFTTIVVERDASGALLTLNRPEKRNAIDRQMVHEIRAALGGLRDDPQVRTLILAGAGDRVFAAGADIAELLARDRQDALAAINSSLFKELEELPFPTIAAIRGFALGGGLELAMACDLRVAGRSARMGQPEVSLGILPGAGAIQRLPRLVGYGRAKELIFTGRIIDADEAMRIGLVNLVVDDAQVLAGARDLASAIARHSALAVRLSKAALHASVRQGAETGLLFDAVAQALCFEDEDKRLRMTAFLEKKRGER
ncbi:MAG: enoyl-CoA hydratase-related protein [Planctomycetota bacterium]